jgi:hypothetical protein
VAFLGAQLGAATAPLLITGVLDPREGMVAIALGVLWLGLASDRRAKAVGRFVLGARPDRLRAAPRCGRRSNRLLADSTLIPLRGSPAGGHPGWLVTCALLGAALVAAFQGPAPVVVLVLGIAQTTGHLDLRTALAILTGSGLGAAIGALLTRAGRRANRGGSRSFTSCSGSRARCCAGDGPHLERRSRSHLVAGSPPAVDWGKRVLLPNMGRHLGVRRSRCRSWRRQSCSRR